MREMIAEPLAVSPSVIERLLRHPIRLLAWLFFGLALSFAVVAGIKGDVFFFRLATEALIFGGLALSVDLLLGRTGLLPLGQALFFGFGADPVFAVLGPVVDDQSMRAVDVEPAGIHKSRDEYRSIASPFASTSDSAVRPFADIARHSDFGRPVVHQCDRADCLGERTI